MLRPGAVRHSNAVSHDQVNHSHKSMSGHVMHNALGQFVSHVRSCKHSIWRSYYASIKDTTFIPANNDSYDTKNKSVHKEIGLVRECS